MNERILVIENRGPSYQILKDKLEEKGCVVLTAQNEHEFWGHACETNVELVLFDICLKNRLSSEVYAAILNFQQSRKIPVIFKTGMTDQDEHGAMLYDENYIFFPEPVGFERLYVEIQKLLNQRQLAHAA